jgi:hypothetical protein
VDEAAVRAIVREEIASLAGKALRRTQDRNYTRSPDRNMAIDVANEELAEFWGEVLSEYGDGSDGEKVEKWPVPEGIAVDYADSAE